MADLNDVSNAIGDGSASTAPDLGGGSVAVEDDGGDNYKAPAGTTIEEQVDIASKLAPDGWKDADDFEPTKPGADYSKKAEPDPDPPQDDGPDHVDTLIEQFNQLANQTNIQPQPAQWQQTQQPHSGQPAQQVQPQAAPAPVLFSDDALRKAIEEDSLSDATIGTLRAGNQAFQQMHGQVEQLQREVIEPMYQYLVRMDQMRTLEQQHRASESFEKWAKDGFGDVYGAQNSIARQTVMQNAQQIQSMAIQRGQYLADADALEMAHRMANRTRLESRAKTETDKTEKIQRRHRQRDVVAGGGRTQGSRNGGLEGARSAVSDLLGRFDADDGLN